MASEVFNLKTLDLESTVVRGARVGLANSPSTNTLLTYPVEDIGNTGANYVIQANINQNNQRGFGTFNKNSVEVTGVTGIQGLTGGDTLRNDKDTVFYPIERIEGDTIILKDQYLGETVEASATARKVKLGSVLFEYAKDFETSGKIFYDKEKNTWGVTGSEFKGPIPTRTGEYKWLEGVDGDQLAIEFLPTSVAGRPDLVGVDSVYKTVVNNTTDPITDLSLSPIPYPHSSLKVFFGPSGDTKEKTEGKDYVINYSQEPDLKYPMPPFEERDVAFIRFIGYMDDERQVEDIGPTFEGLLNIVKVSEDSEAEGIVTPVQNIFPRSDIIKVGEEEKSRNKDYTIEYENGIVTFVNHNHSEFLADNVSYDANLMWDGISVVRGVKEEEVQDLNNLIVPPVEGLDGIDYPVYFEDSEERALTKTVDYIIEPNSGMTRLFLNMKNTDAFLVSYFTEGVDEEKEDLTLSNLRTKKFPILADTVTLTKKWKRTKDGVSKTGTTILEEGEDYIVSYMTGKIDLVTMVEGEEITALTVSYTPLAEQNVVLQPYPEDSTSYRMTILDDRVETTNADTLVFTVQNQTVSVPVEDPFKELGDSDRVSYSSKFDRLHNMKILDSFDFSIDGYEYKDSTREIKLAERNNDTKPVEGDVVVATYDYVSSALPYAPMLSSFPILEKGESSFVIEGFDRTQELTPGTVLRVNNFDPEEIYYFIVDHAEYDGDNTKVYLKSRFSNQIRNPRFQLLDEEVNWMSLPEGTEVDKSVLPGSNTIVLRGNPLKVRELMRLDSLIEIEGKDVYTIEKTELNGNFVIVTVSPNLLDTPTDNIRVSNTPVYAVGDTELVPKDLAITDPEHPAFTVRYESPINLEGSATVLIDSQKVILKESVAGKVNPQSYFYRFEDYNTVRELADAIKDTDSTFHEVDPTIPEYKPFSLRDEEGKEQYFLPGAWSIDTVISFEEGEELNLPYTFRVLPEMFTWTLVDVTKDSTWFGVQDRDRTSDLTTDDFLRFRSSATGKFYYHIIENSVFDGSFTQVNLKDSFRENMVNPQIFRHRGMSWRPSPGKLLGIDREASTITLEGDLSSEIEIDEFVLLGNTYVYKVDEIGTSTSDTVLTLSPTIDENISQQVQWDYVRLSSTKASYEDMGRLSLRKLKLEVDYEIEGGTVLLTEPIQKLERFSFSYLGLDNLAENEGQSITASCGFFTSLPVGSRLDVYMDYLNQDQFYVQSLTERSFLEIESVPQIEEIIQQKSSGGGQGSDTSSDDTVKVYEGGGENNQYLLRDEEIKKALYKKLYDWYHERERNFASEAQLTVGFKYGKSENVVKDGDTFSIDTEDVESDVNYTLLTDEDLEQINNGFSRFFPVGYDGASPIYPERFGTSYTAYNEVYCYNISWVEGGKRITQGRVLSQKPYWWRESDIDHKILTSAGSTFDGGYVVPIKDEDKTFKATDFSFLNRISIGDKVQISGKRSKYEVSEAGFNNDPDNNREKLIFEEGTYFRERGVKTFNLIKNNDGSLVYKTDISRENHPELPEGEEYTSSLDNFEDSLPVEGYTLIVQRDPSLREFFPVWDDRFNYGIEVEGGSIEGHEFSKDRIKKFSFADLLAILFPVLGDAFEPDKNFRLEVGSPNEETLSYQKVDGVTVNLKELNFFEERKVSSTLAALYKNIDGTGDLEKGKKGLNKFFYLNFERVYDALEKRGYRESIVLRAKLRDYWMKILISNGEDIANEYGFEITSLFKNFYNVNNVYRFLLMEKQGWEVEYRIVNDIFDHTDKIARSFENGTLNGLISPFKDYLISISDVLRTRIPKYEEHLKFLSGRSSPLERTLQEVHGSGDNKTFASDAIRQSYDQAESAIDMYGRALDAMYSFKRRNNSDKSGWQQRYIPWSLGMRPGLVYQSVAEDMFRQDGGRLTLGLEQPFKDALTLSYNDAHPKYEVLNPEYAINDRINEGKILIIRAYLQERGDPDTRFRKEWKFSLDMYPIYQVTLNDLVDSIGTKTIEEGSPLFSVALKFDISPYGDYTTANLVRTGDEWLAPGYIDIDPFGTTIQTTNVEDHSSTDARILYLNRRSSDSIRVDNDSVSALRIKVIDDIVGDGWQFTSVSYALYDDPEKGLTLRLAYTINLGTTVSSDFFDIDLTNYSTLGSLYHAITQIKVYDTYIFIPSFEYEGPEKADYPVSKLLQTGSELQPIPEDGAVLVASPSNQEAIKKVFPTYVSSGNPNKAVLDDLDIQVPGRWAETAEELGADFFNVMELEAFGGGEVEYQFVDVDVDDQDNPRDFTVGADTLRDIEDGTLTRIDADTLTKLKENGANQPQVYILKKLVVKKNVYGTPEGEDEEVNVVRDTLFLEPTFETSDGRASNITFGIYALMDNFGKPKQRTLYINYDYNKFSENIVVQKNFQYGLYDHTTVKQLAEMIMKDTEDSSGSSVISVSVVYQGLEGEDLSIDKLQDIGSSEEPIVMNAQGNILTALVSEPNVVILKQLPSKPEDGIYDLREFANVDELVRAINDTREGGIERIFRAARIGDENSGSVKSFEFKTKYVPQYLSRMLEIEVPDLDDNGAPIIDPETNEVTTHIEYQPQGIIIGWELETTRIPNGSKSILSIEDKRYSPFDTYPFLASTPPVAYQSMLEQTGSRVLPFDLFSWDDNATYQINNNVLTLSSDNVSNCSIQLMSEEMLYDVTGSNKGLINRINTDSRCNKFFYANLVFNRSNDGAFEYGYLPNTTVISIPKSTLDSVTLGVEGAVSLSSEGANSKYKIVPTDVYPYVVPDSIHESTHLVLESDVRAFSILNNPAYSSTFGLYQVTTTSIALSASYVGDYQYEKSFDLTASSYNTLGALVSALNSEVVPDKGDSIFNASLGAGVSSGTLSSTLVSGSGSLPAVLQKTGFPNDAIVLNMGTIVSSGYSVLTPTYTVTGNVLTVTATIQYSGIYVSPLYNLASYTVQSLSDAISSLKPISVLDPIFLSEAGYHDGTVSATELLPTASLVIGANNPTRIQVSKTYPLTSLSIQGLVDSVNNDTSTTGFSLELLESYGTRPANRLVPVPNFSSFIGSVSLDIDLRDQPAFYLLNMDGEGDYLVATGKLYVQNSLGTVEFQVTTTDMEEFVKTIKGDLKTNLLAINILPIAIPGSYGVLDETKVSLSTNEGTHVYFGFLGDIQFFQISDYDLNQQLRVTKRRLAKGKDFHNTEDYSDNDLGLSMEQFLFYMKYTRFNQLRSSLMNEGSADNQYLWLYLKFHREYGSDQMVKTLAKRIEEDGQDATRLGGAG